MYNKHLNERLSSHPDFENLESAKQHGIDVLNEQGALTPALRTLESQRFFYGEVFKDQIPVIDRYYNIAKESATSAAAKK